MGAFLANMHSLLCDRTGVLQVDTVLSRLTALKERIEGTEALIEIDLDHRRNELVAFDLVRLSVMVQRSGCNQCGISSREVNSSTV